MKNNLILSMALAATVLTTTSCGGNVGSGVATEHHVAVINPGHFHAALVTKSAVDGINDTIKVYAPAGEELEQYKAFIDSYNNRETDPTQWVVDVTEADDFMQSFLADETSDIVVLAGDNRDKTDYILAATGAGKNVLADKPMAIDRNGFEKLQVAYSQAKQGGNVIYELMTERHDTLNILTRQLLADVGGLADAGDEPVVTMKSVHHFYKEVSGKPLTRPVWYYDVTRQGEGIADVTTHLIDLIMWQCFPGEAIDYVTDVEVVDAGHYATHINPEQFKMSTGCEIDAPIDVYANGYILARIKGKPVRLEVEWRFTPLEGGGDTFSATYRGKNGAIEVVQDETTGFVKQLYVVDAETAERRLVDIPVSERLGHEEHFNRVVKAFLKYLDGETVPEWECANTLAKYYITTEAVEMARAK